MNRNIRLFIFILILLLPGCTSLHKPEEKKSIPVHPTSAVREVGKRVVSADGLIKGEIFGTPAPASKFSKLQIGMTMDQVKKLIGTPDSSDSRITGKQYQPFYFGGDTQRTEAYYNGEGRLTFSNSKQDSAPDTLILIKVKSTASEKH